MLYDGLSPEITGSVLYGQVEDYLEKYMAFNNISTEKCIENYINYARKYISHCKQFIKSGKYPAELQTDKFSVSREEYDVVLILMILFTPHRFRIMQLLVEHQLPAEKALYIGLGSGLEIELTRNFTKEIHAYDLTLNKFLFTHFPGIRLNAELYTGQYLDYFDEIYMIELLEHVPDPYELLDTCYLSMKKGGRVLLTTATDIPQFDHLYNFKDDHSEFEEKLNRSGFSVSYKEKIPHQYLSMELQPCNHFYIIEKF